MSTEDKININLWFWYLLFNICILLLDTLLKWYFIFLSARRHLFLLTSDPIKCLHVNLETKSIASNQKSGE